MTWKAPFSTTARSMLVTPAGKREYSGHYTLPALAHALRLGNGEQHVFEADGELEQRALRGVVREYAC